jgi:hypothetical protein
MMVWRGRRRCWRRERHGGRRMNKVGSEVCGFAARNDALSRPCRGTLPRQAGEGKADGGARGSLVFRRKGGKPLVGHPGPLSRYGACFHTDICPPLPRRVCLRADACLPFPLTCFRANVSLPLPRLAGEGVAPRGEAANFIRTSFMRLPLPRASRGCLRPLPSVHMTHHTRRGLGQEFFRQSALASFLELHYAAIQAALRLPKRRGGPQDRAD